MDSEELLSLMGYLIVPVIVGTIMAALLGLIPASIARRKGYSFGLWWFYGWMLFIVAIIHVNLIEDKTQPKTPSYAYGAPPAAPSAADELKKYKDPYDQGAITEIEFQQMKAQLLKQI